MCLGYSKGVSFQTGKGIMIMARLAEVIEHLYHPHIRITCSTPATYSYKKLLSHYHQDFCSTCPWGKGQLPFGYWGEGGWRGLQPSLLWLEYLVRMKIITWPRSWLESLEYRSHLVLSLKVILQMAVEQICKISSSNPYLSYPRSKFLNLSSQPLTMLKEQDIFDLHAF